MEPFTISGLRGRYLSGEVSLREVMSEVERRIEARGDAEAVWISRFSVAEIEARISDLEERHLRGERLPLYGIPFAVKDNIDAVGLPTTAGCPAYAYNPRESATAVDRLLNAGAILIGKTNLDQFATGLVGTRSPHGIPRSVTNSAYISGGSSAGSAVAVAGGVVAFSLGTDTAGSGRVPAAFNGIVGLKPTRGRISTRGVVPACRSLDCVSIFAHSSEDAAAVLHVMEGEDPQDPYSRAVPSHVPMAPPTAGLLLSTPTIGSAIATPAVDRPLSIREAASAIASPEVDLSSPATDLASKVSATGSAIVPPSTFRFGTPPDEQLEFFGDEEARELYWGAVSRLAAIGGERVEFDFAPFREAAELLYGGPWVAEREVAVGDFIRANPGEVHPVVRSIILGGEDFTAADTFRAMYRLEELQAATRPVWKEVNLLLLPTTGTIFRVDDLLASPFELNTKLGVYTNFMNLLDLCGVALPAGARENRTLFGITLVGPAFADEYLLSIGERYEGGAVASTVRGESLLPSAESASTYRSPPSESYLRLAVVGAHLSGQPLNTQLTERGARLVLSSRTSPRYGLFALAGTTPPKPGLVQVGSDGASIEIEVWELSVEAFGSFVADVPAPLAIGTLELEDGSMVKGFVCEPRALDGALDITSYGGWRAFLKAQRPTSPME